MKCPNCGTESPDGKKFCGDCRGKIPELPSASPMVPPMPPAKRNWWKSNWKVLAAVIVTFLVTLPALSQVHTKPWSRIRVKYVVDLSNNRILVHRLELDRKPLLVAGGVHEELKGT